MGHAIDETNRRRAIQTAYNQKHGITPKTVAKAILDMSPASGNRDYYAVSKQTISDSQASPEDEVDLIAFVEQLREQMLAAAENLEFETAARLHSRLKQLRAEHGDLIADDRKRTGRKRGRKGAGKGRR